MTKFYWVMMLLIALSNSALGQYGLNFHHIYSWYSNNTPQEIFVANMKAHKVKSVRRISALESARDRDGLLEFDKAGNLVTHQTAAGHAVSKYYYDDSNRVIKILVRKEGAPDTGSYTAYEYDKKNPRLRNAERMRDRKGRLLKTLNTWEVARIGDTSFTIQKAGNGTMVDRVRSYSIGDTVFYDITRYDKKGTAEKTEFYYQVSKDGKVLHYGDLEDRPSQSRHCKAPQVHAAVLTYMAAERKATKDKLLAKLEEHKKTKVDDDDDRPALDDKQVEAYIEEMMTFQAEEDSQKVFVPSECYVYDDKGRLIEKISKYGDGVTYSYDEAGRLKTAGDNIYHYNEKGLLKAWYQSDNEVKLEYTFY